MARTIERAIKCRSLIVLAVGFALGLGGCASTSAPSEKLIAARLAVQRAKAQTNVDGATRVDVDSAQYNLARAEAARKRDRSSREVDQLAYIAEQSAMAAISRHEAAQLRQQLTTGEGSRSAAVLEARERDARMAEHKADTAELEAARVQQLTP